MAQASVFRIFQNDGKADLLLCDPEFLHQRLNAIKWDNEKRFLEKGDNKSDPTPTLNDIEGTHVFHLVAHYRPFVSMGWEYMKVPPQSGVITLNQTMTSEVKFSIPQYGDFFHDMVLHIQFASISAGTYTAPTQPSSAFPANDPDPTPPAEGQSASFTKNTYKLVDSFGNSVSGGASVSNLIRWCEYPGERLLDSVIFRANGNEFDRYTYEDLVMLRKFGILPNKIDGYKRLNGQQSLLECDSGPISTTLTNNQSGSTPATGTADTCQYRKSVSDGAQTPKTTQPALDLYIKLRFWFNENIYLALPSVSVPVGQRDIIINLAAQQYLLQQFMNTYLETTATAGTMTTDSGITSYTISSLTKTYTPLDIATYYGSVANLTVSQCELYTNNIVIEQTVQEIYIKKILFQMIRVYYHQPGVIATASGELLMNTLRSPVEYLWIGFQPTFNQSTSNIEMWREWHHLNKVVYGTINNQQKSFIIQDTTLSSLTKAAANPQAVISQIVPDRYVVEYPTISTIELDVHGIAIFSAFPPQFYNGYLPYHYGGIELRTPDDTGAFMINFAIYPRSYQPSGYMNASRTREFYLKWTTSWMSTTYTVKVIITAIGINFLMLSNGDATLRFTA
ncbi:Large eukaryotic DNA virus major capsid protein [uncultured archaeon]|nr:Large eukaryotic DNA virus major capsid protein [uncultured archaeon]